MRAAATLLVVGFGLSASADDTRTLASRLAHPNYHDRETATKQLIAVGVPALSALEEVRRNGSPEAVCRRRSPWTAGGSRPKAATWR